MIAPKMNEKNVNIAPKIGFSGSSNLNSHF